jgi:hypothetical protein
MSRDVGWSASLSCRTRASAGLVGALVASLAWPGARPWAETIPVSGEVLAVGEDGTLLLDGDHGLELLVVHPDAEIRDFRSRSALSLARIRPGDLVESATKPTNGMRLVWRLVVTPVGPREEPNGNPGPPRAAQCCPNARLIFWGENLSPLSTAAGAATGVSRPSDLAAPASCWATDDQGGASCGRLPERVGRRLSPFTGR